MKKLLLMGMMAGLTFGSVAGMMEAQALTPETTNEYFTSKAEGGIIGNRFKAQAVRTKNQNGQTWLIRILFITESLVTPGYAGGIYLTLEEGRRLLEVCKSFAEESKAAKASTADIFEKRVGITEKLDIVYRQEKDGGSEFWLSPPDNMSARGALTMDKGNFDDLVRALQVAIDKAVAGQ